MTKYVIRADGLVAGKGAAIAESIGEAMQIVGYILGGVLGKAGDRIIIEKVKEEVEVVTDET